MSLSVLAAGPPGDVMLTLGVVALAIAALALTTISPDLVLVAGLALLMITGVIGPDAALSGFANQGLVTVAVLFIVAEGIRQTGGVSYFAQRLLGQPGSITGAQARVMLPSAVVSAFLNNTPVVAILLPVLNDWAKRHRLSVSQLMLPLSYATILGGLCTLIGTSTTLVVNDLLKDAGHRGLELFELAIVGFPCAVVGLAYLLLTSRWLLPERVPAMEQFDDPREYTVEMLVDPSSPLVGQTIEAAGLRHLSGVFLADIEREGRVLAAVSPEEVLRAGDRLVFVGVVDSVIDLQKIPGLKPATEQVFKLDSPRLHRTLIEAVVSHSCPLAGMTIREARFRTRYNAVVIAVSRNGARLSGKIGDIELAAGDTLLLEAHPSFVDQQRNSRDFYLVSLVKDSAPPRHERAVIAQLILLVMVVLVSAAGWTMLQASLLAAGLMVLTRCVRWSEAKRSIDWGVLITMAAGIGIGRAMDDNHSGAAQLLADLLLNSVTAEPLLALIIVYGITMVLTNVITAKAAAVLVFPLGLATAARLQVEFTPFAIAIMIAAAASLATPIGYQTNLMVYGPGGYRYSDFVRIGGPLSLLLMVVAILIIPFAWPF